MTDGAGDPESLIVGGDGTLGSALAIALAKRVAPFLTTTRRADNCRGRTVLLDLSKNPGDWQSPPCIRIAYLLAAMTSQAACRADPDASHLINVTNTVEIARRLVSAGARVVFPSTNHVFDGTVPFAPADRARCPDTVYGEQKAAAEEQLLALGDAVCVIRFGKILPHNHPMFSAWIADLAAGRPVTPFADVVFSPIDQAVAIDVLCRLGEGRHSGLWQLTANDDISYADAARRLAHGLGAAETLVQPVTAAEVWRGEPFPAHTTLDSARIAAELNVPIPTPYDELDRMIQTRTEG